MDVTSLGKEVRAEERGAMLVAGINVRVLDVGDKADGNHDSRERDLRGYTSGLLAGSLQRAWTSMLTLVTFRAVLILSAMKEEVTRSRARPGWELRNT